MKAVDHLHSYRRHCCSPRQARRTNAGISTACRGGNCFCRGPVRQDSRQDDEHCAPATRPTWLIEPASRTFSVYYQLREVSVIESELAILESDLFE